MRLETMTPYPELLAWWAVTITWSIVFLTLISAYLYIDSAKRRRQLGQKGQGAGRVMSNFVFVWILLGLLILYILSIDQGSAVLFAIGNVIVEVILLVYLLMSKAPASE